MNKKKHNGQAAMEYLMTYGWVLLSILVIVAILFSSGVFDKGKVLTQECKLIPDLPCLTPGGEQIGDVYFVYINISNGLGYSIQFQEIKMKDLITNIEINNAGTSTDGIVQGSSLNLDPGDSIMLSGKFNGNAESETRTFFINMQYERTGSSSGQHWVSGRIRTKIEAE